MGSLQNRMAVSHISDQDVKLLMISSQTHITCLRHTGFSCLTDCILKIFMKVLFFATN